MKGWKLTEDRILVKPHTPEAKSAGGVILPDAAQEKPVEGVVVGVSGGRRVDGDLVPLEVEEGDVVLFSKYAGISLDVDGEDLLMVSHRDVLMIREPTPN